MRITTLGTSHGDHTYCRFNSSVLLETGNRMYLFDAGSPVEALLIRAGKRFGNLKAVFITHMHNDHVGGLPGLLKARMKLSEEGHTDVLLPEPQAADALGAWLEAQHVEWPSSLVTVRPVRSGEIFNDNIVRVNGVSTRHLRTAEDRPASFAFVVQARTKRIIYTGDLSPDFSDFPEIARRKPTDLCICEATHPDMHEAVAALQSCPIKRLIFSHVGAQWHGEGEAQLRQLTARLPFPCVVARDGNTFDL